MPQTSHARLGALVVLILAAAVYANTLAFGAAWDDTRFVFQSGATEGITAAPDLLLAPYLRDVPPARSPYRPVTAVSYALDWSLGGGQARVFHWTNVLLHVGVTGLLLAVFLALGVPPLGAVVGGLWFAVHPVHVEAVANLAGRAELLAAFFGVAAVLLFLKGSALSPGRGLRATAFLSASATAFALALGAKENAVVVLPILGLVALLRPEGGRLRTRFRHLPYWLGLVALGAGYLLLRRSVLGTFTTVDVAPFIGSLPTGTRISTAVAVWWEYLRLMAVPVDLVVDYGPAVILPSPPLSLATARGAAVLLAAVALVLGGLWRRTRLPAMGLLWFGVAVFPVSNLAVPIAQWLAERFLYLPSAGVALAIAATVPLLVDRPEARRVLGTSFAALLVLFVARTWTRNATWRDTETVAATLVEEHPEAFRSQWLLGVARLRAGETEAGLAALENARELNPGAMELHLERAYWLLVLGRPDAAEATLRPLPAGMHPDWAAHMARALAAQGRVPEARAVLDRGAADFPATESLRVLRDSVAALDGVSGG